MDVRIVPSAPSDSSTVLQGPLKSTRSRHSLAVRESGSPALDGGWARTRSTKTILLLQYYLKLSTLHFARSRLSMLFPVSEVGGFTLDCLFFQLLYRKWRLRRQVGRPSPRQAVDTHAADK